MTSLDMDPNDRETSDHRNFGFERINNAAYLQVFSAPFSSIRSKNSKSKFKTMVFVLWC